MVDGGAPSSPFDLGRGFAAKARRAWRRGPLAQARLEGPVPDRLAAVPPDPYPGDRATGERLLKGRFLGGAPASDPAAFWSAAADGAPGADWAHGFSWLRDLKAMETDESGAARALVDAWIQRFGAWDDAAWSPETTAERLVSWLSAAPWLVGDGALFRSRLYAAIARQTRHLSECAADAADGAALLSAAAALAIAGVAVPQTKPAAERGFALLRRELRLQVLPDGGHASRNPLLACDVAVALRRVVETCRAAGCETPQPLRHALDRIAAHVRFHTLPDGRLAIFNGGAEGEPAAVAYAAGEGEAAAAPFGFAGDSGYHRAAAARARLIVDGGAPPPAPYAAAAHASALSFTFASGRRRIFVNCGDGARTGGAWANALRTDEAHTAPIARFADGPARWTRTTGRKRENRDGRWIDVEREGLAGGRLVFQTRRLFLSADGDDLRGEDAIETGEADLASYALRFHVHPAAKAVVCRDDRSALITLDNQEAWRFKANAPLRIEESVHSADGAEPRKTSQIVVDCADIVADTVRWGVRKLDRAS